MNKPNAPLTVGARVRHAYTQALGTVRAVGDDALGPWAGVWWDDPAALELPFILHTEHLQVVADDAGRGGTS